MFSQSKFTQAMNKAFGKGINRTLLLAVTASMLGGSAALAADLGQKNGIADTHGAQYSLQRDLPPQRTTPLAQFGPHATVRLMYWNQAALDATGLDHTPLTTGETRVFGEQFGPHRASRAMAIIHIAMYDAVNAILGGFQPFSGYIAAPARASVDAAIAQAAHDTLVALYPSQKATFDTKLTADLANIVTKVPQQKTDGIAVGAAAAAAILALRANDGADKRAEPVVGVDYTPTTNAGDWAVDPVSQTPLALGAFWGQDEKPFVVKSASQFRIPPPLNVGSAAFATQVNEIKQLGGDGTITPTTRTADQTVAGIFWAYDAAPSLCAPPRLYNQIVLQIAEQQGTYNVLDLARLLAMANTSMADSGLTSWESKWYYHYWRPIGAIRGIPAKSNNAGYTVDTTFMPLGGQSSNLNGPNFTPPFPSYPSGHATFGGTIFQVLRNFYGTDDISFTLTSDEFNGVTRDNNGNVRPQVVRSFDTLSQAEDENGQSRLYLGIHYRMDKDQGINMGRNIANYVYRKAFRRVADR